MFERIHIHLLPDLIDPESLADRTVVVVDVLRATTTIAHALSAGCRRVIACSDPDEARALADQMSEPVLLGGERGGRRIPGFHLGNSPLEYGEGVRGKTILFTTTNGTRALHHCDRAERVLLAAFVNLSAVCVALAGTPELDVVCAGTDGELTREDALLAGALLEELVSGQATPPDTNDQADIVRDAWQRVSTRLASGRLFVEELVRTRGGRNLVDLGMEGDIEIAASLDRLETVPVFHPSSGEIRSLA